MDRDKSTGRFITGNKAAIGNRGNTNPKWKNRNAVKHGFSGAIKPCWIDNEGKLNVLMGRGRDRSYLIVRHSPGMFRVNEEGEVSFGPGGHYIILDRIVLHLVPFEFIQREMFRMSRK